MGSRPSTRGTDTRGAPVCPRVEPTHEGLRATRGAHPRGLPAARSGRPPTPGSRRPTRGDPSWWAPTHVWHRAPRRALSPQDSHPPTRGSLSPTRGAYPRVAPPNAHPPTPSVAPTDPLGVIQPHGLPLTHSRPHPRATQTHSCHRAARDPPPHGCHPRGAPTTRAAHPHGGARTHSDPPSVPFPHPLVSVPRGFLPPSLLFA